jgi:hypothetical protein
MFFKKISHLLLTTCIFFAQAFPNIIESPSISEVTKHVTDENTLVIFDIDNTILEAKDLRATDKWFSGMTTYAQSKGYNFNEATQIVLLPFGKAMEKTTVKAVEEKVSDVIKDLQKKGNTVIALTSRSLPFVECTPTQLNSLGINLSQPPLGNKEITMSLKFPAKFMTGILFCANNDKGEALQTLFKELKIKTPSKIVYIDDKEKYLIQVQKFTESIKTQFVGIRYSYMDNEVKSFVLDEESKKLIPDLKTEQLEVENFILKTPETVSH